jgi:hypothetical protein
MASTLAGGADGCGGLFGESEADRWILSIFATQSGGGMADAVRVCVWLCYARVTLLTGISR